jgi:ribose transport system substrate-binding protein
MKKFSRVLLLTGVAALVVGTAARADDYVSTATKAANAATARASVWDGPKTGPKAAANKKIVFVAGDLKNGGILGASEGVKEAAKAIGWTVTVVDGQGSVSGRTAAMSQALTLKPDGIIAGGFDTNEQKVAFDAAAKSGAAIVGWHSGTRPGPEPEANIFANVTTLPRDVSNTAAFEAIKESGGKAGVVIFTDSQFEIAVFKARAMEAAIKKCAGCTVLEYVDSPIGESSQRMPQLTTTLLQKYGAKWTHSLAINDLYFDFMGPSLSAAGIKGDAAPRAISAGDGSESAFQRIRGKQYQAGTVPEPLNMQGWQLVDELNRAFGKVKWSGYISSIHLVTADNVAYDGGDKNIFDPSNGYRDKYKQIWGVK